MSTLPDLQPGQVAYFAYGSNMNPKVLTGMRQVECKASVPAKAEGWTLGFHLSALPYVEPGMGTIEQVTPAMKAAAAALAVPPGCTPLTSEQAFAARVSAGLHGVVHVISSEGWEKVKRTEGVAVKGIMYQPIELTVQTYDGKQVTAVTLQGSWLSHGNMQSYLPAQRYINAIREGAKANGVDPAYCQMLDSHPAYLPPTGLSRVVTRNIIAGVCWASFLPLVPACVVSVLYNRYIKKIKPGDSMFAKPQAGAGAAANQPVNVTATTATPTSGPGGPAAPADKPHEPPPMIEIIKWMNQNTNPQLLSLYFLFHQSACRAVHYLGLRYIFGSGFNNNDRLGQVVLSSASVNRKS